MIGIWEVRARICGIHLRELGNGSTTASRHEDTPKIKAFKLVPCMSETSCELQSKFLQGGYIGNHLGDYHRAY